MNAVKKELAIPIPTIIGQKAWREEHVANIYAAIKALVAAINAERDKQNEDVRKSVNKTYTYYMQNLNKQIEENKSLRAENDALKTENNKVKQRISQLDEKAVERVTTQLVCAKEELASAKKYNTTLMEMYNDLKARWNAIWQEPEMTDARRRVEARKEKESAAKSFLSGMSWKGFTDFKQECVTSWTKLFATNEVQFTDNAIDNLLTFVDHMSCSADTYVSLE